MTPISVGAVLALCATGKGEPARNATIAAVPTASAGRRSVTATPAAERLHSTDARVVADTLDELARRGGPESIRLAASLLTDTRGSGVLERGDWDVVLARPPRIEAVYVLRKLLAGDDTAPKFIGVVKDSEVYAWRAWWASNHGRFGEAGPVYTPVPEATPTSTPSDEQIIRDSESNPNWLLRLGRHQRTESIPALRELTANSGSPVVRAFAREALAMLGTVDQRDAIEVALRNGDPWAAWSLARLGGASSARALGDWLDEMPLGSPDVTFTRGSLERSLVDALTKLVGSEAAPNTPEILTGYDLLEWRAWWRTARDRFVDVCAPQAMPGEQDPPQ